jgi:hypothetical protein
MINPPHDPSVAGSPLHIVSREYIAPSIDEDRTLPFPSDCRPSIVRGMGGLVLIRVCVFVQDFLGFEVPVLASWRGRC